jgi:Xaa-Pro aminopeptidase
MAVDEQRYQAVLKVLEECDLQAIVCFSSTEVLLLTGYWPVMGLSLAVFTRGGGVYAILPQDELEIAQATSSAKLIPYKPASLDKLTHPIEALLKPLKKLFTSLSLSSGRMGTNLYGATQGASYQSTHHFRGAVADLLQHAALDSQTVSVDAQLDRLKAVKTPTEIDLIYRQASLAATGFIESQRRLRAGRREDEVAAEIEASYSRMAHEGFQRCRGYYFCMSGPNSTKAAGAYARTRSRVLQEGDIVMIHANTVGDGYWTDITRSYVIGEPTNQQRKMQAAIQEAREAALKIIAPGMSAKVVDAAARRVLQSHGFGESFRHSAGHGVGFAATDPQALPRLHPASPDVLEAGMTFNLEPAIYLEGVGGMRNCDMVACTSSGAQVLTEFP